MTRQQFGKEEKHFRYDDKIYFYIYVLGVHDLKSVPQGYLSTWPEFEPVNLAVTIIMIIIIIIIIIHFNTNRYRM